jgi:UDP-N-acetyl-D-mannosaminuronic acid transferase (WecB/TagA/CpsF family)
MQSSYAGSMQRTVANVSVLGQRGEWAGRLIEVINAAQVDVVWVRMTELKHKEWVDKIFHRVMATFVAFIEAEFDFYTMTCPRAPQWMCARYGVAMW